MKTPRQVLAEEVRVRRWHVIIFWAVAVAAALVILAREYQTDADLPVRSLLQAVPCDRIGQLDDGRALWAGDCAPATPVPPSATVEPSATVTPMPPSDTQTPTTAPSATEAPTSTPVPTETPVGPPGALLPFPDAPACADHATAVFHTLWNSALGCHYDHEHGTSPFTAAVSAAFPGFDLTALLGGVQIGHTNPSSPAENVAKHGGMKWQVDTAVPNGCAVGFEGGTVAVDAYAIQHHAFGRQDIEFESRQHSAVGLLRQCQAGNPDDHGYIFFNQLQEYGERCLPYQGQTLLYPDNFTPLYNCAFGQYITTEGVPLVRPSLQFYHDRRLNNLTIWTSKTTGSGPRPPGSTLYTQLWRGRDAYMVMDTNDLAHPFTWLWLCSSDGGATYDPAGCRYNNSTVTIHEIAGRILAEWDNLAGWDTDPEVGRITATGYVTRYGVLAPACTVPGLDCHPIKLVRAFVGKYSSEVSAVKVSNPTPADTPSKNIFFCGGVVCAETDAGAMPSSWIGPAN